MIIVAFVSKKSYTFNIGNLRPVAYSFIYNVSVHF